MESVCKEISTRSTCVAGVSCRWKVFATLLTLCVVFTLSVGATAKQVPPGLIFSPELVETLPLLQADRVHQLGITGAGVAVAVVDIFSPNPKDPCGSAHGNWIEGLIHGVAPDARIERFSVRTVPAKDRRTCYIMDNNDINRALNQILDQHQEKDIRVVNLSWGGGKYLHPCNGQRSETTRLIQALIRADVVVVTAAGNNGFSNALLWPACLPKVISVGASFDYTGSTLERTLNCAKTPTIDEITCYSNTATFLDVLAPGSRASVSSSLSGLGTSASSAYVSGIVALMRQANPELPLDDVRFFLTQTGKKVKDSRNGLSFPRVNALKSVQAVLPKEEKVSPAPLKGDINRDGKVDKQDVLALLSALGGVLKLDPDQQALADVAEPCNEVPSFTDYHYLKRMLAGEAAECSITTTPAPSSLTRTHAVLFMQQAQGILLQNNMPGTRTVQLTVFDLSGQIVFSSERSPGNTLLWRMRDRKGQRAPNGIYLLVTRGWGSNGSRSTWIKKVALLR